MLTIRCARCNEKILRYEKIGKGRLWRCWKDRVREDHSVREGNEVRCRCGNVIGVDTGKAIKIKPRSITYTGTVKRK